MEDPFFDLLTEEDIEIIRRVKECTTMEQLLQLEDELSKLNENREPPKRREINMTLEEFKERYGLIGINDLKGKYGF